MNGRQPGDPGPAPAQPGTPRPTPRPGGPEPTATQPSGAQPGTPHPTPRPGGPEPTATQPSGARSAATQPDTPGPAAIAVVAGTAAGRRQAERLVQACPGARLVTAGSVAGALREAWHTHRAVVAFVASGIVVRVLAPLLHDKHTDPAVVVVDETARHVVPLLGGHVAGANELAREIADRLGATAVLTTATDLRDVPGLDTLGWPVEGALAAVTRALLDGEPVRLISDATWPLPALPANVRPDADSSYTIRITDRVVPIDDHTVVLRPPSLVAGVGASRGAGVAELDRLLERALAGAGLSPASLRCLVTADIKADEPGIAQLARRRGLELVTRPVPLLATVAVPTPSETVRAAVGTPSVAEAAALLGPEPAEPTEPAQPAEPTEPARPAKPTELAQPVELAEPAQPGGTGAELVVPKTASRMGTVAIARHAPRGRLVVIGIGPGARDLLAPRAVAELRAASVVVGLRQYVKQVADLLRPGTRVLTSAMGAEQRRIHLALEQARAGHAVALISSGDAGVYAMASPALDEVDGAIDVAVVPGVTAGLAAAAVLGAPLGHDHVSISLSDLHTDWPVILQRVRAAAASDLVVVFYNPRSRGRDWQLPAALGVLAEHRPPQTPVGLVRNASRPDESSQLSTLAEFDPAGVDMYGLVIVGNRDTRVVDGRMITPRGYRWREPAPDGSTGPDAPARDGAIGPDAPASHYSKLDTGVHKTSTMDNSDETNNYLDIQPIDASNMDGIDPSPSLVIIGHGTRRPEGVREFRALVDRVRRRAGERIPQVEGGMIELAEPSVPEAVARVVAQDGAGRGLRRVVAVPLMLGSAGHVKSDIPRLLDRERSRHPLLRHRYARPLGPHPVLVRLLADRVDAALAGAPRAGTQVVLVGRGCSDAEANADVARVARLLWEGRGYDGVDLSFVAVTGPSLPQALERARRGGATRLVVAPYLLFPGLLSAGIEAGAGEFAAAHPTLDVRVAGLLGDCDEIADLVLERYRQAVDAPAPARG